MKRIALTIAIIFGIALGASAQNRGLFDRGPDSGNTIDANHRDANLVFLVPYLHGTGQDQEGSPLGSGALLLIGFGAAYAIKKRKQK